MKIGLAEQENVKSVIFTINEWSCPWAWMKVGNYQEDTAMKLEMVYNREEPKGCLEEVTEEASGGKGRQEHGQIYFI